MRYLTMIAVAVTVFASAPPAHADERDEALAAVKACQEISADTVRLACLDAATRLLDSLPLSTDQPISTQPTLTPPAPSASQAESDALARERASLAAEREALARQRAELEQRAAAQAALSDSESEAAKLAAERAALEKERTELANARAAAEAETKKSRESRGGLLSAPRGLGLFAQDDRPKRYATNVARIIVNSAGRHFFVTEDGTRWKQVPPRPLTSPPSALPAGVTIRRTASGSRRIAFDEFPSQSFVVVESGEE